MPNAEKLVRERLPDMAERRLVRLAAHEYPIVPQRIGYLRSKLGVALGNLDQLGLEGENIVDVLGDRAYGVLKVFVPGLMPEWEFMGFATQEAMDGNDYDEQYDKSPSLKEIKTAFLAAAEVNEIDLLKHLGKLIGPEVIRGYVAGVLVDNLESRRQTSDSPSSSAPSTEPTPSMTSGTTLPTSNDQQGSPSLAS